MSRKKRIGIIAVSIALIIAAFAGWYYYAWKHPKAEKLTQLPADCDILCVVNSHLIAEEILFSGDLKQADTGRFRKYFKSSGLDLVNPFWIIGSMQNKYFGIAVKISDEKKLDIFLKETLLAKYNEHELKWVRDSFSFYQKTGYFYAFKGVINKWTNHHPIGISDTLAKKDLNGKILSGWCQLPEKWATGLSGNKGRHFFEMVLHNGKNAKKGIELITQNLSITGSLCEASEFPLMLHLPLNLFTAFPEGKRKTYKFLKESGFDTTGIFNTPKGQLYFSFLGLDTIYNTSISYVTDEEFNRKEIITKTPRIIPAFNGFFTSQSNDWVSKTKWDSTSKEGNLKNIFGIPIWFSNQNLIYEIKNSKSKTRLVKCIDPDISYWLTINPAKIKKPASILMPAILDYLSPDIANVAGGKIESKNMEFLRIEFADDQKSIARNISDMVDFYTKIIKK